MHSPSYSNYLAFKSFQEKLNKIYLCRSGGDVTGNINMNCNRILDVSNITFCNGKVFDGNASGISGDYLELTGGTMSGNINMDCNRILDVSNITFCNGKVFDGNTSGISGDYLELSGGTMSGNINMDCNRIIDVSNITFCDGTYIGHGSSFDISTSEILKINNNMLVIDTNGNLGIGKTNPTDKLDISNGNIYIRNGIIKSELTNRGTSSFKTETGTIFIGSSNNIRFNEPSFNLILSTSLPPRTDGLAIGTFNRNEDLILGVDNTPKIRIDASDNLIYFFTDINMDCNRIIDVSGIYFCDGTYIGHGSSFDISTNEELHIKTSQNIELRTANGIIRQVDVSSSYVEHFISTETDKVNYYIVPLLEGGAFPDRYDILVGPDDKSQLILQYNENNITENFAVLATTGKSGLGDFYLVSNGTRIEVNDPLKKYNSKWRG